jgi:hypothetical protein
MMTFVAISPSAPPVSATNKYLISDELWGRLARRIVKEGDIDLPLAERIMDQALGFLKLCAEDASGSYGPSELVDIGWHTFILYTREYAEFCQRVAGRFIHHAPSDVPGITYDSGGAKRTVDAMLRRDISVDKMLWANGAKCSDDGKCTTECGFGG